MIMRGPLSTKADNFVYFRRGLGNLNPHSDFGSGHSDCTLETENVYISVANEFPVINYSQLISGVLSGGWAILFGQNEYGETWDPIVKFSVARHKMASPKRKP